MKFGEQIKSQRQKLNMTQAQVAKKLFVTRQTVSNWEKGKSYPDLNMLVNISDAYQVSIDSLLKEDQQLKEYLLKKEVERNYESTSNVSLLLIGLATMAVGVISAPSTFPKPLQGIVSDLITLTVFLWVLRDFKFSNFISQRKDASFVAKIIQSKLLVSFMVFMAAISIIINMIGLITGKSELILKLGNFTFNLLNSNGRTSAIIVFSSGIVLICAQFYYTCKKLYQQSRK